MMKLSRGALAAVAAAAAIPATYAIAKTVDHGGWQRMSPETRGRLDEGRLAMVKAALKLTPDQEKLWSPIEAQVRDTFKLREARRAEFQKKRDEREKSEGDRSERKRPDMSERIEKMSERMSERADRMKAFAGAFKPFYASLSDEQKDVLRPLMRGLAPGFGHGRHGPRFAEGWGGGPRDGWGGGWWGDHRGGHGHHRGPAGDDGAGGGGGGPNKGEPPAPQHGPDSDDNDGGTPPQE